MSHMDDGVSNELTSVWKRASEIFNHLHVPPARHLLSVRTFLPQIRKSTRAIPASVVQRLNWSQSIFLQVMASLLRAQHLSGCCNLLGFRPTNKTHCITSCPGPHYCLYTTHQLERPFLVFRAQADLILSDPAIPHSKSGRQINQLSEALVSSRCFHIRHNLEHPNDLELEVRMSYD